MRDKNHAYVFFIPFDLMYDLVLLMISVTTNFSIYINTEIEVFLFFIIIRPILS